MGRPGLGLARGPFFLEGLEPDFRRRTQAQLLGKALKIWAFYFVYLKAGPSPDFMEGLKARPGLSHTQARTSTFRVQAITKRSRNVFIYHCSVLRWKFACLTNQYLASKNCHKIEQAKLVYVVGTHKQYPPIHYSFRHALHCPIVSVCITNCAILSQKYCLSKMTLWQRKWHNC